ncbi:MAG TPA: hypothetical protein VEV82_06235, partial [Actinomycetota bacterium]|nr:hypothetical protein [Actinomycetota bacterium]
MKKSLLLAVALVLTAVSPASADHAVGTLSSPVGEPLDGAPVIEEGNWDFIANFPAGPGAEKPIGVDVEMFKRKIDGKVHKYAITSSMTIGFTIFDVTNPETPVRITDYGTAACGPEAQVQQIIDFLANGQDFQDSPLGTVHGWEDDVPVAPSAEAMVDLSVVDCSGWTLDKWKEEDLKSARIKLLTLMRHPGINLNEDSRGRKGIQISHKSDPVANGKLVAINDERGGGLNAPPGPQPAHCGGGGIWFYDVRNADNPKPAVMRDGRRAVFFPGPTRITRTEGSNCTSHVFWEWHGVDNLVSAAWYSSGTQVFRYKADFSTHPATVR